MYSLSWYDHKQTDVYINMTFSTYNAHACYMLCSQAHDYKLTSTSVQINHKITQNHKINYRAWLAQTNKLLNDTRSDFRDTQGGLPERACHFSTQNKFSVSPHRISYWTGFMWVQISRLISTQGLHWIHWVGFWSSINSKRWPWALSQALPELTAALRSPSFQHLLHHTPPSPSYAGTRPGGQ